MKIPKKLKDEIWEYCRLNDITDIDAFTLKSAQQGFNIEKYGTTPFKIGGEPEVIEKEVIKVITATTEVEIIKEVQLPPIIKEVIVEVIKEVTVTDNELVGKLNFDKKELNQKIVDLLKHIDELNVNLKEEKTEVSNLMKSDGGVIKKLNQKIKNLEIEIELEKNRNYKPPKKEKPEDDGKHKPRFGNVINWVSKSERKKDDKDLYGE